MYLATNVASLLRLITPSASPQLAFGRLLCKITIPDRGVASCVACTTKSTSRKESWCGSCRGESSMWQSIYAKSLQRLGNGWGIISQQITSCSCGSHQDLHM